MNREEMMAMALNAGLLVRQLRENYSMVVDGVPVELERFAALVAAKERGACAQMVQGWNTAMTDKLAAAIRARGQEEQSATVYADNERAHNITNTSGEV